MNVALRKRMTVEQFLAWENRQQERWEFDGVQPVAMVGSTVAHSPIRVNVISRLNQRLRGGPCRVIAETVNIMSAKSLPLLECDEGVIEPA